MKASPVGLWILLGALLVCAISVLMRGKVRPYKRFYNRQKDRQLRRRISDSLEESLPIHIDIGSTFEGDLAGCSAMAAMKVAEKVASQMAFCDQPWIITCGTGTLTCFERDAVKTGLITADYGNDFESDTAEYAGFSFISHQSASLGCLNGSNAALHMNVGSFGSAVLLQDLAVPVQEGICVGGDDFVSQAVSVLSSDELYIGEQVFEIPEVLTHDRDISPLLVGTDLMRYAVFAGIIAVLIVRVIMVL